MRNNIGKYCWYSHNFFENTLRNKVVVTLFLKNFHHTKHKNRNGLLQTIMSILGI